MRIVYVGVFFVVAMAIGYIFFMSASKSIARRISDGEVVSQERAVQILKAYDSSLIDYPSDDLPPRSIAFEKAEDGWYVGFVQNGSGVEVIEARCFHVTNQEQIISTGELHNPGYPQSGARTLSPSTCELR